MGWVYTRPILKVRDKILVDYILEMKEIRKTYPGVVALDNVNLDIERGEIHALVGENGAGDNAIMMTVQ